MLTRRSPKLPGINQAALFIEGRAAALTQTLRRSRLAASGSWEDGRGRQREEQEFPFKLGGVREKSKTTTAPVKNDAVGFDGPFCRSRPVDLCGQHVARLSETQTAARGRRCIFNQVSTLPVDPDKRARLGYSRGRVRPAGLSGIAVLWTRPRLSTGRFGPFYKRRS